MNNHQKIVGVFQTEREAIQAVDALKRQGYRPEEISIVARDKDNAAHIQKETGTKAPEGLAAGAATGGVLGGTAGLLAGLGILAIPGIGPILAAGPIAATLTGLAVGAGAGGLVGGLVGLGIPEDEANRYNDYVKNGHILVLVDAHADRTRNDTVYDAFRTNNSLNANTYDADYGAGIGSSRSLR
ncbi:general stress protein [Paenibacillus rigui]|uniref:Low temperature-induced protein n=1 Tax=Paenibacillus rigui TaxID=554312 RepID=A0A229UL88_9BACL|nr:general stress protein [Paenibacillus rigui]OXM84218.1 low temperature-induced protein [Paenibacillus rigui]